MGDIINNIRKFLIKEKYLILVRGVPGSGKSSFAKLLAGKRYQVFEADNFFMASGEYRFDPTKLHMAHTACKNLVEYEMDKGVQKIFVSNTFTKARDLKPYYELAAKYEYKVFCIIVENRHKGKNTHYVPEETLVRMENELKNNLKFR